MKAVVMAAFYRWDISTENVSFLLVWCELWEKNLQTITERADSLPHVDGVHGCQFVTLWCVCRLHRDPGRFCD